MNIYEKMEAISAEIMAVAKNLNVGFGKSQYKAVGEADVLAAVKPIEAKYKVYSYPYSRRIVESGVMTSRKSDGSEVNQNYLRLETVYRFVDTENPAEFVDIPTYGDGVDPQDKAPGKAMTYGDKYALLKAYKIITGEDPDQYMSEEMLAKKTEEARAKTLTASEWRALQESIMKIPDTPPASKEEAKALIDAVLARYGHSSDEWEKITVGVEVDIKKDRKAIKDELAKNAWKAALS